MSTTKRLSERLTMEAAKQNLLLAWPLQLMPVDGCTLNLCEKRCKLMWPDPGLRLNSVHHEEHETADHRFATLSPKQRDWNSKIKPKEGLLSHSDLAIHCVRLRNTLCSTSHIALLGKIDRHRLHWPPRCSLLPMYQPGEGETGDKGGKLFCPTT